LGPERDSAASSYWGRAHRKEEVGYHDEVVGKASHEISLQSEPLESRVIQIFRSEDERVG
jgi:hypothetical protein